jgi:hypothetical protein
MDLYLGLCQGKRHDPYAGIMLKKYKSAFPAEYFM